MKLEICIPTYNHPKLVEYLIEKYDEMIEPYDIRITFYDSSENNLTKDIVKKSRYIDKKVFPYSCRLTILYN